MLRSKKESYKDDYVLVCEIYITYCGPVFFHVCPHSMTRLIFSEKLIFLLFFL